MEDIFAELRQLSADQRELTLRLLQKQGVDIQSLPLPARADARRAPLSTAQQRLLALHELSAGLPTENVPVAIDLMGELDQAALSAAVRFLIERHEILRTTIHTDGQRAEQRIHDAGAFALVVTDLAADEYPPEEADITAALVEHAAQLFDPAEDWLMRPVLFRINDNRHILLLTFHQLAADGWAVNILTGELGVAYAAFAAAKEPALDRPMLQFADYAEWEQEGWGADSQKAQVAYWVAKLAGAPPLLDIPTGRPRPATPGFTGGLSLVEFDAASVGDLRELAKQEGVTLFTAVLASLKVLLAAYSGQQDIVVGTLTSRRGKAETESMVGNFGNNLLLRSAVPPTSSFRDIVRAVNDTTLDAMAYQDAALDEINAALDAQSGQRIPAFQVGFIFRDGDISTRLHMPDIEVRQRFVDIGTARLDLWLDLTDSGSRLTGEILYRDDVFDALQVELLSSHWANAIRQLGKFPELPVAEIDIFDSAGLSPARAAEVADLLKMHPAVEAARVTATGPLAPGAAQIAFVRAAEAEITGTELRNWLSNQLEFPLGPAMFTEADALADLSLTTRRDYRDQAAPESELEKSIAALWSKALGVEIIYATDNFFDLGGHSLLAVQVLRELRELGDAPPDPKSLVTGTLQQLAMQMSASDAEKEVDLDNNDPPMPVKRGLLRRLVRRPN